MIDLWNCSKSDGKQYRRCTRTSVRLSSRARTHISLNKEDVFQSLARFIKASSCSCHAPSVPRIMLGFWAALSLIQILEPENHYLQNSKTMTAAIHILHIIDMFTFTYTSITVYVKSMYIVDWRMLKHRNSWAADNSKVAPLQPAQWGWNDDPHFLRRG